MVVNGSPTGFFSTSRGLCQGEPIFQLLFIFAMEVLSTMSSTASDSSNSGLIANFSGRHSKSMPLEISHLLFAMTLSFFVTMTEQIITLWCILGWFEALTGLRVNLSKSSFLPGGK